MSRLGLALLVAVTAGVFGALFGVLGCDKETTSDGENVDSQYELLTILGDAADRLNDADGRWRPARVSEEVAQMSEEKREKLREILSLPYLQGSTKAPELSNVATYDAELAYDGLNVYASGHAPAAYVMDMLGNVLHEWRYDVTVVWPDLPNTVHNRFFRRVYAYPNGDLLAVFEGIGLLKLDEDSQLLWSYRGGCHHEAVVTPEGNIYALTRRAQMVPRINASSPVVPDAVTVLSPDGKKLAEHSVLEAIENSPFADLLQDMPDRGDLLHTNSIEVLERDFESVSPHFKRGNILLSVLKLDALIVIDPETGRAVWAATGAWEQQHDPSVLASGRVLLFNNVSEKDRSDVIEFDPTTGQTVWNYSGSDDDPLHSRTCGGAQRLANGNTLITESDNGRALEVTAGGEVVWEFYNPERAGRDDELIATLFELRRVNPGYFPSLEEVERDN